MLDREMFYIPCTLNVMQLNKEHLMSKKSLITGTSGYESYLQAHNHTNHSVCTVYQCVMKRVSVT